MNGLPDCCSAIDWNRKISPWRCPTCGRVHHRPGRGLAEPGSSGTPKKLKGRAAISATRRSIRMEGVVIRDYEGDAIEAVDSEIDAKDTIIFRERQRDQSE